ncbi:MAG: biopolymer transporter ExbD [Alphaproteobacteria bacterium]|nr:biopolymer transporter ExbD [Alphaproteobacteria bacterium]
MMMAGGRTRSGRAAPRISDINVTPFVDVMLVLLVVFMIAAPLISTTVPIKLPNVEAKSITDQQERLAITLDREGKLFIQDTGIEPDALVPRLQAIAEAKKETRISLRADSEQRYGAVIDLMEQLRAAGFAKVDLIFDPMDVAVSANRVRAQAQSAPPKASP